MNNRPYLSPNGHGIDTIEIKRIDVEHVTWDYQFVLGTAGYLHMNRQDANDLALVLIKRLDLDGFLTMDTAGFLQAICHRTLMDAAEANEVAMMEAGEDF